MVIGEPELVVYVHRDNPVSALTLRELDALYSRARRCGSPRAGHLWGAVGLRGEWAERPVRACVQADLADVLRDAALCGGDYRDGVARIPAAGALVYAVGQDRLAIGFGNEVAHGPDVKVVPITPGGPGEPDAGLGQRGLRREVSVYARRTTSTMHQRLIDDFIRSALDPLGRAALQRAGLEPLGPAEAQREMERLAPTGEGSHQGRHGRGELPR
jgi:phosphate transport system substrate-binding protein